MPFHFTKRRFLFFNSERKTSCRGFGLAFINDPIHFTHQRFAFDRINRLKAPKNIHAPSAQNWIFAYSLVLGDWGLELWCRMLGILWSLRAWRLELLPPSPNFHLLPRLQKTVYM
jgi:hypothetical protein